MSSEIPSRNDNDLDPMDLLLAKLSKQQSAITRQQQALRASDEDTYQRTAEYVASSSGSSVVENVGGITTETTAPTTTLVVSANAELQSPSLDEVARLKLELEKAQGKIAQMDQELTQTRITKHTIEQDIGETSKHYSTMHQTG